MLKIIIIVLLCLIASSTSTIAINTRNNRLRENNENDSESEKVYVSQKKNIFNERELNFYKKLNTIAVRNNTQVLCKLRVGDIVEVKDNKIKNMIIDYAIADNTKILLIVLLDDINKDNKELDRLLTSVGYNTMHTSGDIIAIETKIKISKLNH